MMVAVLFAAALLAPRPVLATAQDDAVAKLKAFEGVDHFAADPGGSYKGVADPKLHARLNRVVSWAAASVAAGIRKGKPIQDLLERLRGELWLINPKDLDAQDAERVTKTFIQLLSLAGLSQYDGILIQWLYDYDAYKPVKSAPALPDFGSGG
jgi:hypothetical protein